MDGDNRASIKTRSLITFIVIAVAFLALALRLYYLQIYNSDELAFEALIQRGKEISLAPKRGMIFDRNLIPLTNNQVTPTAILERKYLKQNPALYDELIQKTSLSITDLSNLMESKEELIQIPLKEEMVVEGPMKNIFIVDIVNRYGKDNLLAHIIGYINKSDNSGQAGIEKVHDEYLKNNDKNSFIVEYDRNRSLILDGVYYANQSTKPHDPAGVKLTIDYEIQNLIESILDREKLNGAVIVTEVDTGEILGMASRPNFEQDEIWKSQDSELLNRAIQGRYPPGSIFKLVVLLTALEEKPEILNRNYFCQGYEEVNGSPVRCGGIHGWISIEDGFAKSCNSLFIQMGKELGGSRIMDMARRLGFGKKVNIGLLEEVEGKLYENNAIAGSDIGNISIGQGRLESTPLQITNLMMIVANNGIQKHMSLVKGITNKDGHIIKDMKLNESVSLISQESAEYTQRLMKEVVENGTARSMDVKDIGGAGGKTGTAQARLNRKDVIHGWFAGYYPADRPEYVITVLIEDAELGSGTATPIFEKIVKGIYSLEMENN